VKSFKKKSSYLAVMLLAQSYSVMAENVAPTAVADNQSIEELQEVDVKASKETEHKGYQATQTRVGKVLQDPHDIPQAITSVTHELMEDQQVGSLREALRNVAGLTFNAAEGGRTGDNFNLRGFYTFGDIYLDGIRDTAQYNRETFNLEQVDVLRGSAAMLFGRGQAGGVINQVTKTAKLQDAYTLKAGFGDYGYKRYDADLNKALTDTAAIRINVMDRQEDGTRKNPSNGDRPGLDREGIALSVGFGIGTEDELFINHVYTQTRDIPEFGLRFQNQKPRTDFGANAFWGSDSNFDNSDTRVTTATFTHAFSAKTQWRTTVRDASYERAYWITGPGGSNYAAPAPLGVGDNKNRKLDYDTVTLQSDFNTEAELFGMKHELLTGVEFFHENSFRANLENLGTSTNQFYKPSVVAANNAGLNKFKSDSTAVFAQDSIEFVPDWKVLVGVRRDHMDADYIRNLSGVITPSTLKYSETSYRTGLSWEPSETSHYYVSYSDSFSPTADLYQVSTSDNKPETSQTYELGAKWLFLDGDLALRTALYRAVKNWERNQDLEANPSNSILSKERRTNGLEIEVTGNITDDWQVFTALALMDAKIIKEAPGANPQYRGLRARNTPRATFNLWTTYEFMPKWKVGGGVEMKGERYGYGSNSASLTNTLFTVGPNTAPGYARWDAMLAYDAQHWGVQLNVKNLFDKEYYDALYDNGGFVVPGNGRTAIVTGEYKF
jgi:catecholate siderophore receptor